MWKFKYIFSGGSHCHFNEWGHSSQNMNLNSFVSCKALVWMLGRALEKIFWSVFRSELAVNCEGDPFTLGTRWTGVRAGVFWGSDHLLSLLLSLSFTSDSLRPHGLQHARLPGLSLFPGACSSSCPLSQWCHPTCLPLPVRSPTFVHRWLWGNLQTRWGFPWGRRARPLQFPSGLGTLPPLWPWDAAPCTLQRASELDPAVRKGRTKSATAFRKWSSLCVGTGSNFKAPELPLGTWRCLLSEHVQEMGFQMSPGNLEITANS